MPRFCVAICWRSTTAKRRWQGASWSVPVAAGLKELLLPPQLPRGWEVRAPHPAHSLTRAVGALLRALASSLLALSYSLFSDSSLTAASQISSLLGLACVNTKWQPNAYSESTADWTLRLIQIKIEIRALSIHTRVFFSVQAPPNLLLTFEVYRNSPKQMHNTKIYASLEVGCFSIVEKH